MAASYQILIPKPCTQNWSQMTKIEEGRFCENCKMSVIDFTNKSDRELISIKDLKSEVCGRFLPSQLERNLIVPEPKSAIWQFSIASFLGILGLGGQASFAQQNLAKIELKCDQDNLISSTPNFDGRTTIDFMLFSYDNSQSPIFTVSNVSAKYTVLCKSNETIKLNVKSGDKLVLDADDFVNDAFTISDSDIKNKFFAQGFEYRPNKISVAGTICIKSKPTLIKKLISKLKHILKSQ